MWLFVPSTKRIKKILKYLRRYATHIEIIQMLNEIDGFDNDF